jgi:hypothetical protein
MNATPNDSILSSLEKYNPKTKNNIPIGTRVKRRKNSRGKLKLGIQKLKYEVEEPKSKSANRFVG